jgi:hypothetical protein
MKTKSILTIFTAITLLAMTPAFTLSQIDRSTPNDPTRVSVFSLPQDLGATVNSVDGDEAPFVASSGLSLYFASSRGSGGFGNVDIWVCQRPTLTSAWGAPQNLGGVINTGFLDNQPALSLDGGTMFFNSDRSGGSQDIYMSSRPDPNDDFGWTTPVNLGTAINTASDEVGATYFEDPASDTPILYFVSNRSGNRDIYQSKRSPNGSFNAPSNVTSLNSVGNEEGPAISRNGLEMLFSSDRPGGFGSRDIWVSTRPSTSSPWGPPVNLTTVNSVLDDNHPAHSPDGSVLYFSSRRDGGSGSIDIYTAHRLCTSGD